MAKKSRNIFKGIATKFTEVRKELKRVIWPSRQKLIQTSAVVLVVIGIAIVLLTGISKGAGFILEQIGFYDQVPAEATTALPETAPVIEVEEIEAEEDVQDQEDTSVSEDQPEE